MTLWCVTGIGSCCIFRKQDSRCLFKALELSSPEWCMSPEQFVKWHQGNDIWSLAVPQNTEQPVVTDTPAAITQVVREFANVFEEPTA
jgi:hypothetical protein